MTYQAGWFWVLSGKVGQSLVTDLDVFTNHFCSKLSDLPKVPQKKMPPYTQQPTRTNKAFSTSRRRLPAALEGAGCRMND